MRWLALALVVVAAAPAGGQTCADAHYRWTEKTSLDLLSKRATRVSVSTMLHQWAVPEL